MRFIIISLVLALTGYAKNYNNEIATYRFVENRYHITVSGERGNMAHDPLTLILRGSTKVSEVLVVPRIQGVVKGSHTAPHRAVHLTYYLRSILFTMPIWLLSQFCVNNVSYKNRFYR